MKCEVGSYCIFDICGLVESLKGQRAWQARGVPPTGHEMETLLRGETGNIARPSLSRRGADRRRERACERRPRRERPELRGARLKHCTNTYGSRNVSRQCLIGAAPRFSRPRVLGGKTVQCFKLPNNHNFLALTSGVSSQPHESRHAEFAQAPGVAN